jgi:hypothetical protein
LFSTAFLSVTSFFDFKVGATKELLQGELRRDQQLHNLAVLFASLLSVISKTTRHCQQPNWESQVYLELELEAEKQKFLIATLIGLHSYHS